MGWLSRNALVIAIVLVPIAARSSMGVAQQSDGMPTAGTPVGTTPVAGTDTLIYAQPAELPTLVPRLAPARWP